MAIRETVRVDIKQQVDGTINRKIFAIYYIQLAVEVDKNRTR
jgi:hypothetical protein